MENARPSKAESSAIEQRDSNAVSALVHMRHGEPVTDSVSIAHEFARAHKSVLRTLDSLVADGTLNGHDFVPVEYVDAKGEKRRAIELNERGALVAMPFIGGRNSRAGQSRLVDAFLAMRQRLTEMAPAIPQTLPEALRLAADLADQNSQLAAKVAEQQPKVTALNLIATADGALNLTAAAKTLQQQPIKFCETLRRMGWIYRRPGGKCNLGYQDKVQAGLLTHKVSRIERPDGSEKVVEQVMVTPRGLTRLAWILSQANGGVHG